MSSEYSAGSDLRALFQTPAALVEIPQLLGHLHRYQRQLDGAIGAQVAAYDAAGRGGSGGDGGGGDGKSAAGLSARVSRLLPAIRQTQQQAADTQRAIGAMLRDIERLDQTKKNLVLLMTIVKRLQMLVVANDALTETVALGEPKDYREVLHIFSVVKELAVHLRPYKLVDEIAALNAAIHRTQTKLADDVLLDFDDAIGGRVEARGLAYAAEILELIDPHYRHRVVELFCARQLAEIEQIFRSSDEAGSLENVARRYVFFRKVLAAVQERYGEVFPARWRVDVEVARRFCLRTRDDLQRVLNHYRAKRGNPDVLLNALTATLEFEQYLGERLDAGGASDASDSSTGAAGGDGGDGATAFNQVLLRTFEPYLLVWISQQDGVLDSKFLEYLAAPKLPEELRDASADLHAVPNICASLAELFRTYRGMLAQTTRLLLGPILLDLTEVFVKYLKQYARRVLLPCIPAEHDVVAGGVELILYLTMVLNTADYCSNTATQLEERIQATVDADLARAVSFDLARESFIDLITRAITLLLTKISRELEHCWRQFNNVNWAQMEAVGDVLRYMVDCQRIVEDNLRVALPLIVREGYVRNFCNKVVELVVNCFMSQWRSVRGGVLSVNAEQLLLDLEALKAALLRLPALGQATADDSADSKLASSYAKYVNLQVSRAATVLKLLLGPTKPIDDFVLNYLNLVGDKSKRNFGRVLELKGVTAGPEYQQLVDNFELQVNTSGRELVEENATLAHLGDDEAARRPRPLLAKSPILGGPFSPAVPHLRINNIEKSFKELALNGENKVSKINENFKSFGKLFRKNEE